MNILFFPMENFRRASTWALLLHLSTILSFSTVSHAQDNTDGDDSGNAAGENAAGASGAGSSFIGSKSRDIIIILSVIVGVVVILGVSSAILFLIAKRRQWAVREAVRRSARRVTDAIKSPLTPRFPKSQRDASPTSSRSRKGAVGIETPRSQPKNTNSRSQNSSASFNPKTKPMREPKGERYIDLERGIELKATKASTVQVSAKASSYSQESDSNATQKGWRTFFPFGRH